VSHCGGSARKRKSNLQRSATDCFAPPGVPGIGNELELEKMAIHAIPDAGSNVGAERHPDPHAYKASCLAHPFPPTAVICDCRAVAAVVQPGAHPVVSRPFRYTRPLRDESMDQSVSAALEEYDALAGG
jgi:hypothetical protein